MRLNLSAKFWLKSRKLENLCENSLPYFLTLPRKSLVFYRTLNDFRWWCWFFVFMCHAAIIILHLFIIVQVFASDFRSFLASCRYLIFFFVISSWQTSKVNLAENNPQIVSEKLLDDSNGFQVLSVLSADYQNEINKMKTTRIDDKKD